MGNDKLDRDSSTQVLNIQDNTELDFRKDRYILLEIYGRNIGKRRDIEKDGIVVGRAEDCDLPLEDPSSSRRHLRITRQQKDFVVTDLKSTNGTYLNDVRLTEPAVLKNGDRIKVGTTIFKFIWSDDMEADYLDQLYQYTIRDGLTGLYNKKNLLETLDNEFQRCKRYSRQLSLMMMDLDHFKNINDTYGHLVGDRVLVMVAEVLKNYFRTADFIARFGGEEFCVILPETPMSSAHLTAERIRMAVSNIKLDDNGREVTVTISIGIAAFDPAMEKPDDLVALADKLLYKAKENGRNRVES
ncbi:MAG TPA: GGDEF domain-containing protein [bacterium]|nr:GGDEF domain-containing protein [bacterium]